MCMKEDEIEKNNIYYYKDIYNKNENITHNTIKLKLTFSIKGILDSDKRYCNLLIYDNDFSSESHLLGETEILSKDKSNNINFTKYFILEYHFEKHQFFKIKIIKGITEEINLTLGNIVGSKDNVFTKQLSDNSIFEIHFEEFENDKFNTLFNISIDGNFLKMKIAYLIKYLGTDSNLENYSIYRSEICDNLSNYNFFIPYIPTKIISPDNKFNDLISIEIIDYLHSKKLGEQIETISNFLNDEINLNLENGIAKIKVTNEKEHSFIDCIKEGLQLNLSIAIDFTSSNKSPKEIDSYHYIGNENLNYYEIAIKKCGDILENYNQNQLFSVYGFGGKLPGEKNVNQCFALNGNNDKPEINSIKNVLTTYRNILPVITFGSDGVLSPIIMEINNKVKEKIKENDYKFYDILLILTNGNIKDEIETINNIVESSFLPISIIIVGIGNGDFGYMDSFDENEEILINNSNNLKCNRNNIKFIYFNQYLKKEENKLTEEILKDIPKQITEYYQNKNNH